MYKLAVFIVIIFASIIAVCQHQNKSDYPVDLVYLWVDGDDPTWLKKKTYWQKKYGKLPENGTHVSRFRQFDELKYSLRSVEKNIPWINHIYIVTDNQTPDWLANHPKITIINHTDIFPKDALPIFNSAALEVRIPYIPNLSEHFLFANDDCYIRVPLEKNFFFDSQTHNPRVFVKYKKRTYNTNLWLAQIQQAHHLIAQKYPLDFVITPSHNIQPYRKSYYIDALNEFKNESLQTTYSKFRQETDLNRIIVELRDRMNNQNHMYSKWDTTAFPTTCKTAFSLISRDFYTLQNEQPCLFCLNDFEGKTNNEINITLKILENLFPEKSSFEK